MANGGPFGNPLTTGIALNFDVDMKPYQQMMKDNLDFAKTQAVDRKKKEKEFQDILKNITYDDSKILKRRRDGAKVKYAELISDAIKLDKAGDVGGLTMRIAEFDSGMNNLVDEKTKFNTYEKLTREGKHFGSQGFIDAMNSVDDGETSDVNIIEGYSANTIYDAKNGVFDMHAIPKADPMAFVNKALQGMALKTAVDGSGNPLKPTYLPETGEYKWDLSRVDDPEALIQELGMAWAGGGESNIETMRMGMGLEPEALAGDGAVTNSVEYIRKFVEPKLTGSRYSRKPTPKTGYNTASPPGVIPTGATENTSFSVKGSVADPAQREKAINTVMDKIPTQDYRPTDSEWNASTNIQRNLLDQLGFTSQAEYVYSPGAADKVTISKKNSSEEITLNLDDTFRDNLQTFLNDNTNEVLVDASSQAFYATPENTGNRITEGVKEGTTDKTAAYGKANTLTATKGILVGDKGAIGFNANNPFPLKGNIQQVYKELTIDDEFFEDLKKKKANGNTNANEDLILKMISSGDLKTNETYFKIVPLSSMEPQDPDQQEYNDQFSTQFSGQTGFNEADDGKVQYALIQADTEAKGYFKERYGFTPESTLEPITNPYSTP